MCTLCVCGLSHQAEYVYGWMDMEVFGCTLCVSRHVYVMCMCMNMSMHVCVACTCIGCLSAYVCIFVNMCVSSGIYRNIYTNVHICVKEICVYVCTVTHVFTCTCIMH